MGHWENPTRFCYPLSFFIFKSSIYYFLTHWNLKKVTLKNISVGSRINMKKKSYLQILCETKLSVVKAYSKRQGELKYSTDVNF